MLWGIWFKKKFKVLVGFSLKCKGYFLPLPVVSVKGMIFLGAKYSIVEEFQTTKTKNH